MAKCHEKKEKKTITAATFRLFGDIEYWEINGYKIVTKLTLKNAYIMIESGRDLYGGTLMEYLMMDKKMKFVFKL
jgi:hypothetical protein